MSGDALYKEKYDLLKQVLDITKGAIFVGTDGDGEIYIDLYTKREELFNKIYEIDKKTGDKPCPNKALANKLKTVITDITKRDKEIKPYIDKISDKLKANIKEIKVGKNLNAGYKDPILEGMGTRFDASN